MRIIFLTLVLAFPRIALSEGIHSFENLSYQQAIEKNFHITARCSNEELCDVTVRAPKFYNKYPYGSLSIISRNFEIPMELSSYQHEKEYVTGYFKVRKNRLRKLTIKFDYSVPADSMHWNQNYIYVALKGIKRTKRLYE